MYHNTTTTSPLNHLYHTTIIVSIITFINTSNATIDLHPLERIRDQLITMSTLTTNGPIHLSDTHPHPPPTGGGEVPLVEIPKQVSELNERISLVSIQHPYEYHHNRSSNPLHIHPPCTPTSHGKLQEITALSPYTSITYDQYHHGNATSLELSDNTTDVFLSVKSLSLESSCLILSPITLSSTSVEF
jgi:hypothetical protein